METLSPLLPKILRKQGNNSSHSMPPQAALLSSLQLLQITDKIRLSIALISIEVCGG